MDDTGDGLDTLLALRTRGTAPPLYCVHPGIGMGWCYATLCASLAPDRPIYAIQSPALRDPQALPESVHELAVSYLRHIRAIQSTGPFHLLGWSLGGFVVHEMARILQAAGEEIGLLAVLDSFPGDSERFSPAAGPGTIEAAFLRELGADTDPSEADGMTSVQMRQRISAFGGTAACWDEAHLARMLEVFANSCRIIAHHRPGRYNGDILLLSAAREPGRSAADVEEWRACTGGDLHVRELPCEHRQMLDPQYATEIARAVTERITQHA